MKKILHNQTFWAVVGIVFGMAMAGG